MVSGATSTSRMTWESRSSSEGRCAAADGRRAEVHEAGKVFGVDDADDVLGAAGLVVDGHARVEVLDDLGAGFFHQHL